MFGYYYICKRKIWFASRRLNLESGSELVALGKFIDETTYKREDHSFLIEDFANIDYLKNNTVYEVKKSDKQLESAAAQVKFYLYHLHLRGFKDVKGQLNFPLLKKTAEVVLSNEDMEKIPKIIEEIEGIMLQEHAPEITQTKVCKACAYFDLCII